MDRDSSSGANMNRLKSNHSHISRALLLAVTAFGLISSGRSYAGGVGSESLASMPIREVTIFKDGHAFVLHAGEVPTDDDGNVTLDYLPVPVIGTFWPYANDARVKLKAVSAGKQRVSLAKTAISMRDLLIANVGGRVEIKEQEQSYRATIQGVPSVSADELEASAPAGTGPQVPQVGQLILLRTDTGTRAIPMDRIQDVTFLDDPKAQFQYDEIRSLLKLQLDWQGKPHAKSAKVGMSYLQKGLRWIPHYKLQIKGDGTVLVQLQATILNELADLKDVTANLLVGVPSFDFKSTIDPIALRDTMAQLSPYFEEGSRTSNAFSNSIMIQTQVPRMSEFRANNSAPQETLGPEVAGAGQNEDMFVFTVKNISLAKGERMVMDVGRWTMKYKDVFRVALPFSPPQEVREGFNSSQEAELAKLYHAPKVKHVLRLSNDQTVPLTTAPALVVSDKGVLGQGMMTYTSPGGTVDVTVTTAVNVPVNHRDEEVKRTVDVGKWRGHSYMQIDMRGTVKLTNFRGTAIDIEVVRELMGGVDAASEDGKVSKSSVWNDDLVSRPIWWNWYSWPQWWSHLNLSSRIEWKRKLEPGQTVELPYAWHYYWTH